jgi:hypothetical protein
MILTALLGQLVLAATAVSGQERAVALDTLRPRAGLTAPFAHVTGVHELDDGRLVVLDSISKTISLVDLSRDSVVQIGREGDGPGEYRLPVRLLSFGTDACAIVDLARSRAMLIVDGEGRLTSQSLLGTRDNPGPNAPYAVDSMRHVYSLVRPATGGVHGDSMIIARWQLSPWKRDSLGRISILPFSPLPVAAGSHDPPPFTTYDDWAVARDGWIAIASAQPYRVTLISPTGERTVGPAVLYTPERVTTAHRQEWRLDRERPRTQYLLESGGLVGVTARAPYVPPARWPDVLPAFLRRATRFAPDGSVWVHRAGLASQHQQIDVFDRDARRLRRIVLPPYSRIAGFGSQAVYVATRDRDDLERVVRFGFP